MNEAIDLLREEYNKCRSYIVQAEDEATKNYWRTYAAGILHAVKTLETEHESHGRSA